MNTEIKETLLYQGEVKIIFDETKHIYYKETVSPSCAVDGVTSILKRLNKPNLMPWGVKVTADYWMAAAQENPNFDEVRAKKVYEESKRKHREKSEDAADYGKILHSWIEAYVNNEQPKIPTNAMLKKGCEQLLDWLNAHNVKIKTAEKLVYSKKYNYCGTVDFLGEMTLNGSTVKVIGDWKTSSGIWDEYKLQLAAYNGAIIEEFGVGATAAVIVRCGKDGAFETLVRSKDKMESDYNAFIGLLAAHRWLKGEERSTRKTTK